MEAMITAITGAVDWAAVITGAGTIFGALALVYVAFKGGQMLVNVLRRG
ncbi:hypothetical protein [Stutzerimonas stutzeri]|uniref:Uncharacterized protein n=1 Tax=Stutzerimonas stutzeri RCH2 TaxID=644801 RepID=L0GJ05_STUST|nr:hypothetical protein [Stutzerimonas stutzeri]AGA86728.1 hypothetical protein Psest_2194 [Stutzerimonas stutzeri RCH2]AGA86737.1 hypothetical protein Psest_2203 [Stutzerimonas stutzeri RCH2]